VAIIEIMIPTITMTTAISIRVKPNRFINFENDDLEESIVFIAFTFNGFVLITRTIRKHTVFYMKTKQMSMQTRKIEFSQGKL